jgi:hypothetical protein
MSLLNPFFLLGALALAIPVLIHMVRREKSEIVHFSSLMFLLRVPKAAIRQQILKNLLLLILRLLIIAFLVASFARPYFTEEAAPETAAGENRGTVMMIDNSYSMRYGTNFDRAKNEVGQRIDSMAGGDRMALIAFNDKATVVAMPTSDKNALKAALDTLQPSYAGTRYYEAFVLADRLFGQLAGAQKQLVLISDFQRNGWNRSSRESVIGIEVATEYVDLGVDNSTNVGIDNVSVDATSFSRTYAGRVIARIHNHRRDQTVNVPVSVSINDREAGRRTVEVAPNSTSLAEFTGFDLPLGFSKGRVRIEAEDTLPTDNDFLFTIDRREKLSVLVIDAGRPRQSFFLRQAYTSTVELPYELKIVQAQSVTPAELSSHQVVIVNDVPRLSDGVRTRMNELRKTGQGQLIILGDQAEAAWWNGFTELPVRVAQKIFVGKDRGQPFYSVTSYVRNHPIFMPFERTSTLGLNTAQFLAYSEVEPKEGSVVLAKFENGSPAIIESAETDRGLLVFSSTVDNRWNDLPLKPSFLPLFHEMVTYLSRYSEVRGAYALGEGIPVTGGLQPAAAAVINPDGTRQALGDLTPGQQRFFSPEQPGFYEVRIGPDSKLLAVNSPSAEGNLERMPPDDLFASVKRTQGETQQAGMFGDDSAEDYARQQMMWWYLLLIALLAGIAEIYIANRRTYETKRGTAS